MRVVIIDDEKPAIAKLRHLLKDYEDVDICGEYTVPGELLKDIRQMRPDLLFLDIEMPGISGIELADKIEETYPLADIIFVTAFDRYALEAFEVNAVDYLLKPVTRERLDKTIMRIKRRRKDINKITVHTDAAKLCCFGKLEVVFGEGLVFSGWRSAKVRELLAFYIHNRRTELHRSRIIDALWPDMEYERALRNFNTCNYQLKKQLAEIQSDLYVRYAGGYYHLDLGMCSCDVDDLIQAAARIHRIDETNLNDMIAVIDNYRGLYLENIDCNWADFERDYYERLYVELEIALANFMLIQSEYDKSIDYARRALEKNQVHEEAWRISLKALEMKGDQLALKKQYENMLRVFKEELDIDVDISI